MTAVVFFFHFGGGCLQFRISLSSKHLCTLKAGSETAAIRSCNPSGNQCREQEQEAVEMAAIVLLFVDQSLVIQLIRLHWMPHGAPGDLSTAI